MTLSEEDQEYFKSLYFGGATMQSICRRFAITERRMNEIAYVMGLLSTLQFRWNKEKEDELTKLLDSGCDLDHIAKRIGCTKETDRIISIK